MVDLHCHFLPGVDDGAPDLRAALELARAACENGIRVSVLTPHMLAGPWDNSMASISAKFEQFKLAVDGAGIPLEMHLGAEVRLTSDSLRLLEQGQLPSLGKWNGLEVFLLEFPDGGIPLGAMNAIEFFLKRGRVPMLAHPERNKDVMRSLERLRPFVEVGCLVQLTAASVCGWFGAAAHSAALSILDQGWTTVVATDSHNLRHRPPVLAQARDVLAERYGSHEARLLTEINPEHVVASRRIPRVANSNPA